MKSTRHTETVPSVYATVYLENRPSYGIEPSGNTIYADVEMTQRPAPSSNTIYASIQPTSEAVDMGKSVDYADLDFPRSHQQKPTSTDKITACLSPIYSQPCDSISSASNTVYVEPFKQNKTPTATAPVQTNNADGDQQQHIYSLAQAFPLDDPNVIYSESNKPQKSSTLTVTDEEVKTTDPIYLDAIEVKHGDGRGIDATQGLIAVYAQPIKLKKSS